MSVRPVDPDMSEQNGAAICRRCGNTSDWYHFKSGTVCRPCALRKARERNAAERIGAVVLTPTGIANVRSSLAAAHVHDLATLTHVVSGRSNSRLIAPDGRPVRNLGRSSIVAIKHALAANDVGFLNQILVPARECATCGVPHHVAIASSGEAGEFIGVTTLEVAHALDVLRRALQILTITFTPPSDQLPPTPRPKPRRKKQTGSTD
jgi:hypothetical protein